MHSTNYTNTLILPSDDCRADTASVPNNAGSVAQMQFERIVDAPYTQSSDDLIVGVAAMRKEIPLDEHEVFKADFFSKGQACLRASPLVKTFGWALHHDSNARIALIDPTTTRFSQLSADASVSKVKGMRNKRA